MEKQDLVILKNGEKLIDSESRILPNKFYRHIENGDGSHLVYGELFSADAFKCLFEFAHDKVMRDFKALGLITPDGKPISKTLFINQADIHQYGRGRTPYKIWYFRNSRDVIYGFYPMRGNKVENAKECYGYFLQLIGGDVEPLDTCDVCFGNCGIPLVYSKLRVI